MSRRWLIVALALFYPLVMFASASLKADYSHVSQYISELNAIGSAWSWQLGLSMTYITLYTFALVPDAAEWRGLFQRLAEGILYGCLCLLSWQILAGHNNSTELRE